MSDDTAQALLDSLLAKISECITSGDADRASTFARTYETLVNALR